MLDNTWSELEYRFDIPQLRGGAHVQILWRK